MRFNSSFGLGEIVSTAEDRRFRSELFKIVSISFTFGGIHTILARNEKGFLHYFSPVELFGDPDFDQEGGCYPEEPEELEKPEELDEG